MTSRHWRPSAWLLALAAVVCVYNLPRLLTGTLQFDGLDVHYAAQRYLSDELHAGRVPFWTPYVFSGFPFLADLQVAAWYPLNWPFFALGITPASIGWELLVHHLVASGGAYALALGLVGRPGAAVAAGMFYGLSGWFAAHSQHVGMFDAAAWLPWLVLLLWRLSEHVSRSRLVLGAFLGAAIALPGSFQVALYVFSGAAVWAALESVARRSRSAARGFALGLVVTSVGGALLAAVMIVPAMELVGLSIRVHLNARDVDLGYFHPSSLAILVYPDFYGLLSGHYTGPGDSTQHYFYAGILLVPLALLGLRNMRALRTAAFLSLPFLWYALGPSAGLFRLVARLPGFSSVELPMHGWFLPALGLALLGAAGLAVVELRFARGVLVAALVLVAVDVTVVNQVLNPLAYARGSFDALYGAPLRAFQTQLDQLQPQRVYAPPLANVAYRNHSLQSRVEATYGYNPLELTSYFEYAAAAETNAWLVTGFGASHRLLSDGRLEAVVDGLPLAYFAPSLQVVPDEAGARSALETLDPREATVVVGPMPPGVRPDATATVSVVARDQAAVTLRYVSATANVLRVAIPAYPGWRATLNGNDLPLVTVDRAFIGVVVPPGEGEIRLAYTPRWFWLGALITGIALVVALVALIAERATRWRAPTALGT